MRKFLVGFFFFALFIGYSPSGDTSPGNNVVVGNLSPDYMLYKYMGLEGMVDYEAFEQALKGLDKIDGVNNKNIITLIDFTKPSTEKRLYVLDMNNRKMLFHTHVAHGQGSGENYATSFSNVLGSHQSSLGFYLTENSYEGGNGYSLILNGLEKGINNKVRDRGIVMHGADYCDPALIPGTGRLGRSLGCPALPYELSSLVIDAIKDGSLIYVYAGNEDYLAQSAILSGRGIASL